MLRNYLKIALRNIFKDKYSSILYFLILTIGISSFSVLVLVIDHELSFDKFHKDADSMYRITTYFKRDNGQEVKWAITNGYLPTMLKEQIPEVDAAIKFQVVQSELTFNIEDNSFVVPERKGFYVDSNFFSVMDFPLLYGNKELALKEPNSIIISERLAKKFFGRNDVVGEKIELDYGEEKYELVISGVIRDIPHNSHIQFDFLISGSTFSYWETNSDSKGGWTCHVYFKIDKNADIEIVKEKIRKSVIDVYGDQMQLPVQKFTEVYYNANNLFEETAGGNILYVRILFALSILILVIVTINYSILTASKSLKRNYEIGLRRTLGSSRRTLGLRFIIESTFFSLVCGIISLGITEIMFHFLVSRFIYEVDLSIFNSLKLIIIILVSSILLGVISGIYTASGVINKNVIEILKGKIISNNVRQFSFRNLLVILQFVITGSLIVGNVIVIKQLRYIENKELGYEKDYVINVSKPANVSTSEFKAFGNEIIKETSVKGVGTSVYKFISDYNATGISVIDDNGDTLYTRVQWNSIDEGLISTLNMQMIDGRNFSNEFITDSFAAIINEAAVREMNLENPVGKRILNNYFFGDRGKIIGVVQDFHFQSFNKKVIPVVLIMNRPEWTQEMVIRIASNDIKKTLFKLKKTWEKVGIITPFEFVFMDDWFQGLVAKERTLSNIVILFTVVSIILACLGLVGLVRYTAEQRKREVGVRKVFGASPKCILKLINYQYVKLIAIAFVFMIPISYLIISKWLDSFEFRTSIGVFDYFIAGFIILFVTITVVSIQSLKVMRTNPVDVLKDE